MQNWFMNSETCVSSVDLFNIIRLDWPVKSICCVSSRISVWGYFKSLLLLWTHHQFSGYNLITSIVKNNTYLSSLFQDVSLLGNYTSLWFYWSLIVAIGSAEDPQLCDFSVFIDGVFYWFTSALLLWLHSVFSWYHLLLLVEGS